MGLCWAGGAPGPRVAPARLLPQPACHPATHMPHSHTHTPLPRLQVWKLSATDLCEVARNSVLHSGFPHQVGLPSARLPACFAPAASAAAAVFQRRPAGRRRRRGQGAGAAGAGWLAGGGAAGAAPICWALGDWRDLPSQPPCITHPTRSPHTPGQGALGAHTLLAPGPRGQRHPENKRARAAHALQARRPGRAASCAAWRLAHAGRLPARERRHPGLPVARRPYADATSSLSSHTPPARRSLCHTPQEGLPPGGERAADDGGCQPRGPPARQGAVQPGRVGRWRLTGARPGPPGTPLGPKRSSQS